MRQMLPMLAAVLVLACSPGSQAGAAPAAADQQEAQVAPSPPARHPVSGLEVIDLSVITGETRRAFRVELAATQPDQARGLMFRTELGADEGMLFPSREPMVRSFWMKDTPLSLDIIFIGADGRIINIAANTTPYSLDSVMSDGPALAVLELRGGRAAELGIGPGDKVDW
ncbi:MAG: hypothetical protein A3J40_12660 [Erythrobacter sp. RIFCSPHIGHO2_12_FULL_63_10]|nr:MAG: hypothetical protein A3J40_12660 [Erythrobacter sp. RIFCSPHIGHO2_12_FULL_63_10]